MFCLLCEMKVYISITVTIVLVPNHLARRKYD